MHAHLAAPSWGFDSRHFVSPAAGPRCNHQRRLLESERMDYHEIITVEPDKRGGQPCIRGLRITVYDVLSYLASGMTEEEIISDYPDLTHEDILASLSYAADTHQDLPQGHGAA